MYELGPQIAQFRLQGPLIGRPHPDHQLLAVGFRDGSTEADESFDDFVDRVGHKAFEPLISDLREVGPVAQNTALYEDWERIGLYVLERGEGECAV